jgi:hypothetical protein
MSGVGELDRGRCDPFMFLNGNYSGSRFNFFPQRQA